MNSSGEDAGYLRETQTPATTFERDYESPTVDASVPTVGALKTFSFLRAWQSRHETSKKRA